MPSLSNWWIHAQSTRDLADRMLVRGDVKGARMMLEASAELEKRYTVAPNLISLSPDRHNIINKLSFGKSVAQP